jgi:predicted  nucleic acid-binding Zn-ribbon protein
MNRKLFRTRTRPVRTGKGCLDCGSNAQTKVREEGKIDMAKYGKQASKKVEKAMHERKEGTLKISSTQR